MVSGQECGWPASACLPAPATGPGQATAPPAGRGAGQCRRKGQVTAHRSGCRGPASGARHPTCAA